MEGGGPSACEGEKMDKTDNSVTLLGNGRMLLPLKVGSPEWTDSTTRSRGPTVLEAKLARESGA